MIRPPPNGTPAQSDRTSTPQICTIASASRGRSIGIGPMGATVGAAVAAGAPEGAAAAPAPPAIAATAVRLGQGEHWRVPAPPVLALRVFWPAPPAVPARRVPPRRAARLEALAPQLGN